MLLPNENVTALLVRSDNFTEDKASNKIIEALQNGEHVALITDAGTPGISDPGYILVKKVREELASEIENSSVIIEAIPGPSALAAAISISGIPATPLLFLVFRQ